MLNAMLIKLEISFNSLKVAIFLFPMIQSQSCCNVQKYFYTVFVTILRSNIWREHIELTERSSAVPAEQARSKFFPDRKVFPSFVQEVGKETKNTAEFYFNY